MQPATYFTPLKTWRALAALFLLGLAGNAHAFDTAWTLTSGTSSWSAAYWSNGVPTSTSTVYFDKPSTAEVATGISGAFNILYIGNTGTGNLLVDGGYLAGAFGLIGTTAGSSGSAAVTGGTWVNANYLVVGESGTGALTISGSGVVSNTYGYIGESEGSSGAVTVTGGTWTNANSLAVGEFGTGVLTISGSGVVSSGNSFISESAGSNGSVVVTGGTWTNSGNLYVGYLSDTAALNISGGIVSNTDGYIAFSAVSSASAVVSGGTWTNAGSLTVGKSGTGTLTISDSGVVTSTRSVTIASAAGSKGTLNIGTGGTAGTLNAPEVHGGSGTATVNFNHTGTTTFTANLTGTMTVNKLGSGTTTLTGASTFTGTTNVTGGRLNVNGSFSTWENTINVQNGGTLGGSGSVGAITSTGGTIAVDSGTLTATYLTLDAASTVKLQLGNVLHVTTSLLLAGTLDLSGMDSLTLGSGPVLLIDCDPEETAQNSFDIILVSGSAVVIDSKTFSTTTFTAANNKTYLIKYRGGSSKNDVTIEAVPEPATWALIFGGMGTLALLRRKLRV